MQGVRLVSTPAANRRGNATSGRPESVLAMLEKSMAGRKLLMAEGIRNEPSSCPACSPALCTVLTLYAVFGPLGTRGMVELARFLRGLGNSLPPLVASSRHTPEPSEMRVARFARLAILVLPLAAACEEDNEFGIGLGAASDRFAASLSGANVRPSAVVTTATATAEFTLRDPEIGQGNKSLAYTVTGSGLTSARIIDVHLGGSAVSNGTVLATLFTNPTDTALTEARIVSGSISTNAVVGVSFDSLVRLMKNGAAYVDVHSTARPSGLVRGQISRSGEEPPGDRFVAAALAGSKERPTPVVSTASGSATFEELPDGTVRFKVDVAGLTGATMAHIHH